MTKQIRFAFRITHISNIPHIIEYGIVRADSANRNPDFVSIGDTSIINIRKDLILDGAKVNDCIPFISDHARQCFT